MNVGRIDRNLAKMQSMGASKEEMQQYLNSEALVFDASKKAPAPGVNPPATQKWTQGRPQDDPKSWQRRVSGVARPVLEVGGMVGGGVAAAPLSPAGQVAGGALGYAGGSNIADRLDEFLGIVDPVGLKESSRRAISDIKTGAMYEMGGRAVVPAAKLTGKGIWKIAEKMHLVDFFKKIKEMFPSLSDRGILLKAKETLKDVRQETVVTQKTGAETDILFKRAGIKEAPTYAQKTGSVRAGYFEQSAAAKNRQLAEILKTKDATIDQQALAKIKKQFTATKTALRGTGQTKVETKVQLGKRIVDEVKQPIDAANLAMKNGRPDLARQMTEKALRGAKSVKAANGPTTERLVNKELGRLPRELGVDDVITAVRGERAKLTTTAERLAGQTEDAIAGLRAGAPEKQVVGKEIHAALEAGKGVAKKKVGELYAKIPEGVMVDNAPLRQTVKTVIQDFKIKGGGIKSLPRSIVGQMKQAAKGEQVSFGKLKDLRSQIGEEIRDSYMALDPNLKRVRRLQMLKTGLDDALEQMTRLGGKGAGIARDYEIATTAYKQYATAFRKGQVGAVLRPGRQASGLNTLYSDMPAKFFQAGKGELADDLIRAVGESKATELIKPHAITDFLTKTSSAGVVNTKIASRWLAINKGILNKYGLYDEFKGIVTSRVAAEQATANLQAYQKTIASRILGADTDKVIKSIFSGKGKIDSARTAIDLLSLPGIKGNEAAIRGLQTSFKDFLLKEMEVSGVDVLGNPLRSIAKAKNLIDTYRPAMKILYKDSPSKTQALVDYHKILTVLSRNKNITFAGGSTTAEKIAGTRKEVLGGISRNIAQLIAVQKGKGWFFSSLKNLWTSMTGAPGKFSQGQIDSLLTEAIYNPEVAQTIMMATKKVAPKIIHERMKYHLSGMGMYMLDQVREGIKEEAKNF